MLTIVLAILLLVLGLIQSIYDLFKKKEAASQNSHYRLRISSAIYILVFIIGAISTIMDSNSKDKQKDILNKTFSNTSKISTTLDSQVNKISDALRKTSIVLNRSNLIISNLDSVLGLNKALYSQYVSVNKTLSRQINYETSLLKESAPSLYIMSNDNKWKEEDSIRNEYQLASTIINRGRSAIILTSQGDIMLFSKQNKIMADVKIPLVTLPYELENYNVARMTYTLFSDGIYNFQRAKEIIAYAIIYIKVKYKDVLYSDTLTKEFYTKWIKDANEFGGPRSSEITIAKNHLDKLSN